MSRLIRYARSERIKILQTSSSGSGEIALFSVLESGTKSWGVQIPKGFKPSHKYLNLGDEGSSELRSLDSTRVRPSASVE